MKVFSDGGGAAAERATHLSEGIAKVHVNLAAVKSVVAVCSARGGVGKSAIAANLAAALAQAGRKVALVDGDLNAPSSLAMLGMKPPRRVPYTDVLEPGAGPLGLRIGGAALLPDPAATPISFLETVGIPLPTPQTNGGETTMPGYTEALLRILGQTRYGALDLMLIDLAPGLESLARLLAIAPTAALLLICHPSGLAAQATRRMLEAIAGDRRRVLGIVENMAGFSCEGCHSVRPLLPQGGLATAASTAGIAVLERLPFDPRLAESNDRGTLFVREYPETPLAKQLATLALAIERAAALPAPAEVQAT
jgi:ATP-binding protein involved in chromosome partitioning